MSKKKKKRLFSERTRKLISFFSKFFLVQLLLAFFICQAFDSNTPNREDLIYKEITIEKMESNRLYGETWVYVYSESIEYVFTGRTTFDEVGCSEIWQTLSVGDRLSIIYYETDGFFPWHQGRNRIVEAKNDTQVFRSLEEYYSSAEGVRKISIVVSIIAQVIFFAVLAFACYLRTDLFPRSKKRKKKEKAK